MLFDETIGGSGISLDLEKENSHYLLFLSSQHHFKTSLKQYHIKSFLSFIPIPNQLIWHRGLTIYMTIIHSVSDLDPLNPIFCQSLSIGKF
jgi:hypothetical protein